MSVSAQRGLLPASVASRYRHGYAVVDVETSGLSPNHHRVLQVAVTQVEPDGSVGRSWSSLLDPGCDPGPVHVHGLTRERLAGAPQYPEVVGALDDLVRGRVLVAHNARFDWGFLSAESHRARAPLSVAQRLCTLVLSRRLDLPLPNLTLASVAAYWGVAQLRAHDAEDDVRVLVEILRHSLVAADSLGMPLPLTACDGDAPGGGPVRPAPAPRTPCDWVWPGRWDGTSSLVQGMKVVFTGTSPTGRETLVRIAGDAGLDVMNSASSRTSVVVCDEPGSGTRKLAAARAHGIPVIDERRFRDLVARVAPGTRVADRVARPAAARVRLAAAPGAAPAGTVPPASTPEPDGLLAGRRVLVVGGTHADSSDVRARVVGAGGRAAVNLTAAVTDVVALRGATSDPRWARIESMAAIDHLDPATLTATEPRSSSRPQAPASATAREHPRTTPVGLPEVTSLGGRGVPVAVPGGPTSARGVLTPAAETVGTSAMAPAAPHGGSTVVEVPVLPRGGVVDLPDLEQWSLSVRRGDGPAEVDVVTFLTDDSERVLDDSGLVFFNAPSHPSGSVSVLTEIPDESLVDVDLEMLPEGVTRVVVAAATSGDVTFGEIGPLELVLRGSDGAQEVRSTLDAGTVERSMVLAVLYRRGDTWRFRAVGQGYETGLAELVGLFGVEVDG
jgi:DNA polymerase-3 subunit epsilon